MSQVYSPSAAMVNGVNNYLAAPESENLAVKGGRVISRAVADVALAPATLIESVVFAVLTAITSPLSLINKTKPAFEWAKEHTFVAANASKNAFAGIAGYGEVAKNNEPAPKTKWEQAKEKAQEIYAKAMNLASTASKKVETKHVIGTVVLTSAILAAYFLDVHGKSYNLASWGANKGVEILSWGYNAAPAVLKTGYSAAGTGLSYAAVPVKATYNYATSFFANSNITETAANATSAA